MALPLELEKDEVESLSDSVSIQILQENNDHVAAWHSGDGYVSRSWRTRVPIVALLPAQSFVSHGAMNDSGEFHIEVQDQGEDPVALADDSPEKNPLLHHRKLTEALLAVAAQGGLALFTSRVSNTGGYNSSISSPTGMVLFRSAVSCTVIGFMCCLYAMLLHGHKPGVARILTATGCVATVYGFLAVMGMTLVDHLILVIIVTACFASLPAIAVFTKRARDTARLREKSEPVRTRDSEVQVREN